MLACGSGAGIIISWLSLDFNRNDGDSWDSEKPLTMLANLARLLDEILLLDLGSVLPLLTALSNTSFEKHKSDEFYR